MNNRNRLSLLALLIISGLILFYLYQHPDIWLTLRQVSPPALILLLSLRLALMTLNGYALKLLTAKFDITLRPLEWWGLPIVTTMGNYIAPFSGGMVARAAYLKQKHDLPYSQFISILTATYCVNYWVVGLVGFLVSLSFFNTGEFVWLISLVFGGVTGGITLLVFLPSINLPDDGRPTRLLRTALEGWYIIRADKGLLWRLIFNILQLIVVQAVSFWVAYTALHVVIPLRVALLISLMMMFSQVINLTPGNFGIPETIASVTSGLLGTGAGEALVTSLLMRAATMVVAFTLGPIVTWLLAREE